MRAGLLLLTLFLLGCETSQTPFAVAEPDQFAAILYPDENPTTAAGLELGRRLFFDPILSADSTISCSSCHLPALAFTDGRRISRGLAGRTGQRNAPGLTNIGYLHRTLFWDGRADDLESQALHPVADPNEMGGDWPTVIGKLRRHPDYPERFRTAFGLEELRELNPDHVGKALAQFQRSLISADSKYDRVLRGETQFTEAEALGNAIFFDLADERDGPYGSLPTGECAHCHTPPHFTNQRFFNNGLDAVADLTAFTDRGRGGISKIPYENGLFRVPGLRNVALTAPYMHDGRMDSLEQVIAHYNAGGHYAENRSPNVRPLGLTKGEEAALVAFLLTLTDSSFVNEMRYQSPFP